MDSDSVLGTVLQQLVRLQESRGVDVDNFNFLSLMSVVLGLAGEALEALAALAVALLPLSDIALHLARFVLENAVDIANTACLQESILKGSIFLIQLLIAVFMVSFVFGWVVLPVWMMSVVTTSRMIYYLTGKCIT